MEEDCDPAAILIVALVMALVMAPLHDLTRGFVWPTLLSYLCAEVMLGAMAYLTQSILPSVVVHSLGLLTFFTLVWPDDMLRQWAEKGSADTRFWNHIAQVILFATLALLAFRRLATYTKAAPAR